MEWYTITIVYTICIEAAQYIQPYADYLLCKMSTNVNCFITLPSYAIK